MRKHEKSCVTGQFADASRQPTLETALKVACDIKLFDFLGQDGDHSKSTKSLASKTGANDALVRK